MDPYPWDWWEAVLCRSYVCFTEFFILFVVEHPFIVHSHNNNLHVQKLLGRRRRDPSDNERSCDLRWLQTVGNNRICKRYIH
jgi:hypothetical protein